MNRVLHITSHILRFALGVALALSLLPAQLAHAATFTVDSTTDAVDANPGDGLCATAAGECTLRAAIQESNALAGADSITLPAGIYTLTIPGDNEDAAARGDLDISGNLTLAGAGVATTAVDGNSAVTQDRVFHLPGMASVRILDVTIRGGRAVIGGGLYLAPSSRVSLTRAIISGNTAPFSGLGGGIYSAGNLTVRNSTISGNSATGADGRGGGIRADGSALIIASSLTGNTSSGFGGGLEGYGSVMVVNSRISGNSADLDGGGLNMPSGTLTLINSTISNNRAARGGGIWITGGRSLVARNSTLSGNSAGQQGGGLFAIARVTLNSSTVTGNSSADVGGGIYLSLGPASLGNTILAGNTAAGLGPDCKAGGAHELFSQGYNLVGNNSDCPFVAAAGDQVGTPEDPIDPLLGALADNGGPTWTHALLEGSPAIDAGNPAGCTDDEGNLLPTDQRGFDRHVDGDGNGSAICDIGAYEYGAEP